MLASKLLTSSRAIKRVASLGGSTGGGAYTFTITGQYLGQAEPDRVIAVAIAGGSAASRQVSGVTIGGNAATLATRSSSAPMCTGIYYLAVPSGTSANIVVTFSGSVTDVAVSCYALNGWGTVTLYDTNSQTGTGTILITSGFDTSGGGLSLVAAASALAGGSPTISEYQTAVNLNGSVSYERTGYKWSTSQATGFLASFQTSSASDKSMSVASFS